MKIKNIVALCKKRGRVLIYETDELQYLSDGRAIYPMVDLPWFDKVSFCKSYDVTESKADKIRFDFHSGLPKNIDFRDAVEKEIHIEQSPIKLTYNGDVLIPFITPEGILFMHQEHLKPLGDMEAIDFFIRETADGPYFVIKNGFMLAAIVSTYNVVNAKFNNDLKLLYEQCEMKLFNTQTAEMKGGE